MNSKTWLIIALICVLTISAVFDGLYYWRGDPSTPATSALATAVSAFLLALWVDADSKDHPQVSRPFDYGYLVLIFWLPYLPYYLWRTRRTAGLLMFAGFLCLFSMGFFVQLSLYYLYALN
jgi:hypothetical protein